MGEVTTPGCLARSGGACEVMPTGAGVATGPGGKGEAAAICTCRATRTRRPDCSISISLNPVSSSSADNSRMSSLSNACLGAAVGFPCAGRATSALFIRACHGGKPGDGEAIAFDAEAAKAGLGRHAYKRMVAKFFTREDIGYVHLDHRHVGGDQRVVNGDRRVRIAAAIDDEAGRLLRAGFVDPIDQLAFAVGLAEFDGQAVLLRGFPAERLDVLQRGAAVFLRLPVAEQIEVGAVEDVNGLGHNGFRCRSGVRAGEMKGRAANL